MAAGLNSDGSPSSPGRVTNKTIGDFDLHILRECLGSVMSGTLTRLLNKGNSHTNTEPSPIICTIKTRLVINCEAAQSILHVWSSSMSLLFVGVSRPSVIQPA